MGAPRDDARSKRVEENFSSPIFNFLTPKCRNFIQNFDFELGCRQSIRSVHGRWNGHADGATVHRRHGLKNPQFSTKFASKYIFSSKFVSKFNFCIEIHFQFFVDENFDFCVTGPIPLAFTILNPGLFKSMTQRRCPKSHSDFF